MPETTRIAAALSDRYHIEREIGAGGMATVYLARDLKHDRDVALKILRADLSAVLGSERFLNEVRITARLDHPHILTLIDSGEADGILYYVLPFVRGESLRARIEREKQLGLEDALSITRQIAGALDYAHQHGVVHRDIKPENILIHEGEAMLADFGIALAVKEAGGNRLTETGLSLGTPMYMSPEQATGDRRLDARSDVYSLAAVLYELLAGEPPVTGPTAQAMIAKLITERPTSLRVVRDTVPASIDAAVQKALSKVPADRFASAGEFMRALDLPRARPSAASGTGAPARPRVRASVLVGGAAVIAIAAAALFLARPKHRPPVTLTGRTQLTFTGDVYSPAISPDGKQLAYFTRTCAASDCTWSLLVQDVGGTTTRRVLGDMTAQYGVFWSPDRRNLLTNATIGGRWGTWLVSALGGPPRLLGPEAAAFTADGDSILLSVPSARPDTVQWVRVQALDGTTRDSIRVAVPIATNSASVFAVPGTRWLIAAVTQSGKTLWKVIDRHGRVSDQVLNSCTCGGTASGDALYLARAGTNNESIVRIAIDTTNGRLVHQQDTVFNGMFTGFSVTADGSGFVVDEGTFEYNVWALDVADALHGRFPDSRRILHASTPVSASVAPGGGRLLIARTLPGGNGRTETHLFVRGYDGGPESALNAMADPRQYFWTDSVHVAVAAQKGTGLRLSLLDVRSNAVTRAQDLPDSVVADFDVLPDGWTWIPITFDSVVVLRGDARHAERMPDRAGSLLQIQTDTHASIWVTGWNKQTFDTLLMYRVPMNGQPWLLQAAIFGEKGWMSAPDVPLATVFTTQQSVSLFDLAAPLKPRKVGTVARPVDNFAPDRTGKRAAVMVRDYHGDAWMSQVVRP